MAEIIHRRLKIIVMGLLSLVVLSVGSYAVVHAVYDYNGTVFGRREWHGYFTNKLDTAGIEVLPAISGGQAIPNSVNSVPEFIQLLKNANASGSSQKKTGSAFIVNTMLGRNGPGNGRTVSAADWADLTGRLDALQKKGLIRWSGNVSNSTNSYYQNGPSYNDDAHYYEYHNEAGIRFMNSNGTLGYELLRRCANPMGITPGVEEQPKDDGGVAVGGSESSLGCQPIKIKLTPAVDANGNGIPTKITTNLPSSLGTYTSPVTLDVTTTHTTGDVYTVTYRETRSWLSSWTSVTDAKGVIIRWDPVYSAARTYTSTIGPCYGYQLTPSVTINPGSGVVEPGSVINLSANVTNGSSGGYATKSKSTQWQVSKLVIPAGPTPVPNVASPGIINAAPCSNSVYAPAGSGISCTNFTSGTQVFAKSSTTNVVSQDLISEDQAVGTRICYGLSVIPNASTMPAVLASDAFWRHSQPQPQTKCLIIGKKPKVQVLGGDLSVGKAFGGAAANSAATVQTSITKKIPSLVVGGQKFTFGSWIEYAIYATGQINGAASGSYYADTANGMPDSIDCSTTGLADTRAFSFTQAVAPSVCSPIGGYKQTQSMPDFAASFTSAGVSVATGSPVSTSSLNGSATKVYSAPGDLTLSANPALDHSVILKVNGTVTIAGDQQYANGPYTRASQLPQLVIIAKSIIIQAGVGQVDAWLISTDPSGKIDTCDVAGLSSSLCDEQLTINGPIMAKKLYLSRTFGSGIDDDSGTPAEIINLRPDAYLWAQAQAASSGRVQTVYTTELPPRI